MPHWVALLRAVNLGARNKVPMAALREVFETAGCTSVRTYIQSGNVVFAHPEPRSETLEAAVREAFGIETVVVLRTGERLLELVRGHPFGADTSRSAVAFLAREPGAAGLAALAHLEVAPDRYELQGADVVLHLPNGFAGATLSPARLEKALGVPATARNWRTVARLAELARE